MNSVILVGRLTKDPDIRTSGETMVAKFSIAIDRGKDKGTDYPSITCFGKTAELVEKYVNKGKRIGVQGRLQTGSYEKDGHRVYTTDVIADRIEFLDSANKPEGKQEEVQEDFFGFTKLTDEDIPF